MWLHLISGIIVSNQVNKTFHPQYKEQILPNYKIIGFICETLLQIVKPTDLIDKSRSYNNHM